MAVKVTLKQRDFHSLQQTVESFDGENDQYYERQDGKLEVYRENGTVKVYAADAWASVDGKRQTSNLGLPQPQE